VVTSALDLTPTYALDGLVLNASDPFGVDWIVTEEVGWSDAAPVRLTVSDREDAHGGHSGPVWRNARLISLKGVAMAPDRVTMLAAKDRLRDCADDGAHDLTVTEAHLPYARIARVKQASEARLRDIGSVAFEWEIALRADDPFRYGAEIQTVKMSLAATVGGGLTWDLTVPFTFGEGLVGGFHVAHNAGNAPTYPVLTISGPLTNPTVHNVTANRRTALTLTIADGEVLVVDNAAHTVTLGGRQRFDAVTAESTWWALAPGNSHLEFSAATGATSPELTVTYRPAWK
jgi:hypothetical protein